MRPNIHAVAAVYTQLHIATAMLTATLIVLLSSQAAFCDVVIIDNRPSQPNRFAVRVQSAGGAAVQFADAPGGTSGFGITLEASRGPFYARATADYDVAGMFPSLHTTATLNRSGDNLDGAEAAGSVFFDVTGTEGVGYSLSGLFEQNGLLGSHYIVLLVDINNDVVFQRSYFWVLGSPSSFTLGSPGLPGTDIGSLTGLLLPGSYFFQYKVETYAGNFTDDGAQGSAFTNLDFVDPSSVAIVPAPGAALLGVIGLGLAGRLRRRFT